MPSFDVSWTFRAGPPHFDALANAAVARGYQLLRDSLTITFADNQPVWRFGLVALDRWRAVSPAVLAMDMAAAEGVASFSIIPVRN